MKTARKFWMSVALFSILGLGALMNTAQAQRTGFGTQVGQIITCAQNGPIVVTRAGQTFTGTSTGTGTFRVVAVNGPDQPTSSTYVPVAINVTSTIPGVGTITTSVGNGQPTSATTSINPGVLWPARSGMVFPAVATLDNGTVLTSVGNVSLTAAAANSFNPFVNEQFTLDAPVRFVDAAGQVGFTLNRLDVTFNN